jgi:hypothetical protein
MTTLRHRIIFFTLVCFGSPLLADSSNNAIGQSTLGPAAGSAEPLVQRTVVEDEGSRIETLQVRGQTQQVHVQTKGPFKSSYHMLGPTNSVPRTGANTGTMGPRVWSIWAF